MTRNDTSRKQCLLHEGLINKCVEISPEGQLDAGNGVEQVFVLTDTISDFFMWVNNCSYKSFIDGKIYMTSSWSKEVGRQGRYHTLDSFLTSQLISPPA